MADAFNSVGSTKKTSGGGAFGAVSGQPSRDTSLGGRLKAGLSGAIQPFAQGLETAHPVIEALSRPSQAILQGLHPYSGTLGPQGTGLNVDTIKQGLRGFAHGLTDVSGQSDINLRQAENVGRNSGGIAGGVLDFVGTSALDPTTYVGGGLSKLSKAGQTGIDALHAADEANIAAKLATSGSKSLNPAEFNRAHEVLSAAGSESKKGGTAFANKLLTKDLRDAPGIKFAGQTVVPRSALAAGAEKTGLAPLARTIKNSAIGEHATDLFNTESALNRVAGPAATAHIASAKRRGDAERMTAKNDAVNKVQAAINKFSRHEDVHGVVRDELTPILERAAQMAPEAADRSVKQAYGEFKQTGRNKAANLLRALHEVNKATTAVQVGADIAHTAETALGKTITGGFKSFVRKDLGGARQALGITTPLSAAQVIRKAPQLLAEKFPNHTSREINETLREVVGGDAVHENILGPIMTRVENVSKLASKANLAKNLASETDDAGNSILVEAPKFGTTSDVAGSIQSKISAMRSGAVPLATAVRSRAEKAAFEDDMAKRGFEKITTAAGDFYGPKEVKTYLSNVDKHLSNDTSLAALQKGLGKVNSSIKNLTVNLPPFVLPFAARNMEDNLIQMWQGGFKDITQLKNADNFVAAVNKGAKAGVSWDKALDHANLDPKFKSWYKDAKTEGIVDESFLRTDLGASGGIPLTAGEKLRKGLDVSSSESWFTRWGSNLNRRLEDTSRLAMYFDQRAQGISHELAAKAVRESLFDYRDLTAFEKGLRSGAVPFYTYARKNIPLQVRTLINHPYKAVAPERIQSELSQGNDPTAPDYYQAQGLQKVGSLGGSNILAGIQTPLQGAESITNPLKQLALGNRQEAAQGALANVGGAVQNTLGLGTQLATGVSDFSGKDVSKQSTAQQVAETEIPRYTSGESLVKQLSGTPAQKLAKLTALLTGATVVASNPNS